MCEDSKWWLRRETAASAWTKVASFARTVLQCSWDRRELSRRLISGTELRATRWVNGVAEDLNDLVPGSGWNLVEASGINAEGCMVGNGFNPNNEERGFLLCFAQEQEQADEVPVPTLPQFGWLALVGLLCLFGIRRLTKQYA